MAAIFATIEFVVIFFTNMYMKSVVLAGRQILPHITGVLTHFSTRGGMPRTSITTIGSNIIEYFMFLKTPSMLKDIF